MVTDKGEPLPLAADDAARVIVNVLRNKHAPRFVGGPYSKQTTEAVDVGADVIVLQAEDSDENVRAIRGICSCLQSHIFINMHAAFVERFRDKCLLYCCQLPFNHVTYHLLGDDFAADYFSINTDTGRVRVSRDLKTDTTVNYQVGVLR